MGESTIRFGDDADEPSAKKETTAPKVTKIPSGLKIEIALQTPIHSETAAAGDRVTAVVLRDTKGVVKKGDVVRGHVTRFEQSLFPLPKWVVAMKLDEIEHNGVKQQVQLRPLKGDTFTFAERGNILLNEKFRSEWETQ